MIPHDWNELTIGEIAIVTSGGTPSRDEPSYWDGQIPWVRTTEVQNCKIEATDIPIFITESGLQNSSAKIVPAGTVLMALIGQGKTRGQVALLQTNAAINQNCAAIIFNAGHDAEFFYQYLLSKYDRVRKMSNSAGQSNLNGSTVREINVIIPPLAEQRRIAKILSTWDRAIETTEKLIAISQAQKKALMQQLLTGKKRLPGFTGEWRWLKFSEVFERVRQKNDVGNTNVLTISAQHGLISQVEYFNKSVASEDVRGYTLLRKGDFAYNKSYSEGYPVGAFKPLERYDSGIVSSLYICFRLADADHCHGFFRHYFETGLFNREISAIAQEGARNHGLLNVSVVDFFDTSLHAPSHEEQIAIAAVIDDAERAELGLADQLTALRQAKSALMQQLLTGKRRVKLSSTQEEAV